ncbi:EAL domain-containing protein [Aquabacterium sp.]|uniref:bifunctional diguanylate cyclase/phosphodiesterase n=1 Tax=Aquabacterium sp. TaxID=1872578 RepID=UPI0035B349E1
MTESGHSSAARADEYSALAEQEQNQILQMQQAILESVARGDDHRDVINRICHVAEQLLPNSLCSVMLLDARRSALNVFAAPSIPKEGQARLNGLEPGPGAGSCGNAVYQHAPQYVSNTFTDPRWKDLRQLAFDFNLAACWSVPILSAAGEVIGTFALSSFEHRSPSDFHRKLLDIGSSMISIVLERAKAQEQRRLFQKVLDGSEEGFAVTDAMGRILLVNRAFTKVFGYTQEELVGNNPRMLSSGRHDPAFYKAMWSSIRNFGHWHGEIWNRRKNGEVFPEWLSISAVNDEAGRTTHFVALFSDISDKKNAEATIQYLSSHDALTGLPNRLLLKDRLESAQAYAGRDRTKVALLAVNLDNFKLLNDSLGHEAGDELLRVMAQRLQGCLAEGDAVSRLGGDEFLVVITGIKDVEAITSRVLGLLDQVAEPVQLHERALTLSSSIGVAVFPDDGQGLDRLQLCAEKAMRKAKDSGRNTYRYFTEELDSGGLEHLRIAHGLRTALRENQFTLHYQPQIDLATRRVVGAEALVRWQHPTEGLISPDCFIPVAEQTGIIVDLGQWVLEEACRQAQAWQRAGLPPLMMAVNVSAVQFRSGKLEAVVAKALADSGLDPRWLELELTETVLAQDTEHMLGLLGRLKGMGLNLSIDDFGTGYSNLAYLKKFCIDRLKIDQSFVRDMAANGNDAAIVQAIVQMGRALKLRTIAEGVETAEVAAQLAGFGCDEVQGFHFARPLPADAFLALAQSWQPA